MIIFGVLLLAFLLGGCIWAYLKEKKDYNNGFCPHCKCRTPLKHFDTDSQGGEGFTCIICGYTTWVSWFNSDKKK